MKKILTFIVRNDNKILLLHNNPLNPIHGGDIWYTVTGGVEEIDANLESAVKREVKEETNLDVIDTMYLNIIFKYLNRQGIECLEYVYISFIKDGSIILNEENIGYKWLDIGEFIKQVYWYYDKEELINILTEGINKELYYRKEVVR